MPVIREQVEIGLALGVGGDDVLVNIHTEANFVGQGEITIVLTRLIFILCCLHYRNASIGCACRAHEGLTGIALR